MGMMPEIILLSSVVNEIPNLWHYCSNDPINDVDTVGAISAKKLAKKISVAAIFGMFMTILYASYSKGIIAVGVHVTEVISPIAIKALWWKPLAAAAVIASAVAIIVAAVGVYFAKEAKKSAKERAKDAPSWVPIMMGGMPPRKDEKAKEYAKRLMDKKYGKGNWKQGPNTEYNKIVKYLTRHLGMK